MGYGLWVGLVCGTKVLFCDRLGCVGSVVWWVGLGWVEKITPTDNSELALCFHGHPHCNDGLNVPFLSIINFVRCLRVCVAVYSATANRDN